MTIILISRETERKLTRLTILLKMTKRDVIERALKYKILRLLDTEGGDKDAVVSWWES